MSNNYSTNSNNTSIDNSINNEEHINKDNDVDGEINSNKGDVCPIALGLTMGKLVSKCILKQIPQVLINKIFGHTQTGMYPRGAEQIILAMKQGIEKYEEKDQYYTDAHNGFGRINAIYGLNQILKKFPSLFNIMKNLIIPAENSSYAYIHGSNDGIKMVQRTNGISQGTSLLPLFYANSIQPMINELNKIINDSDDPTFIGENKVKFFLDDGNLLFEHYMIEEILD
jgi:hypothetical protein